MSVTTGNISLASFPTVIGAPVEMAKAGFSFAFSISARFIRKQQKIRRKSTIKSLC